MDRFFPTPQHHQWNSREVGQIGGPYDKPNIWIIGNVRCELEKDLLTEPFKSQGNTKIGNPKLYFRVFILADLLLNNKMCQSMTNHYLNYSKKHKDEVHKFFQELKNEKDI